MPRTRLAARALTGLLVEGVVWRTGRRRRRVTDTLAGVSVQVSVWATVLVLVPLLTDTLTGFQVQYFIRAANFCRERVCMLL